MTVLDASAVLAYLGQEPGFEVVRDVIGSSRMSAANWAEVLQKSRQHNRDGRRVGALLQARGIAVEPVTVEDAEAAAELWSRRSDLSLADRLCLALAGRLGCQALTADGAWAGLPGVRSIR